MVEKVINAEYILLVGMSAAEDYIQFAAFREWRDLEDLRVVCTEPYPEVHRRTVIADENHSRSSEDENVARWFAEAQIWPWERLDGCGAGETSGSYR
jgi:hypothetical protein